MNWWILILWIIVFLVLIIAFCITIVNSASNYILFLPTSDEHWVPQGTVSSLLEDSKYSDLTSSFDLQPLVLTEMSFNRNNLWLLAKDPTNCQDRKVILFCHGNSGNISQRRYIVEIACWFDVDVLLFDYRGFGSSHGAPTTYNICNDSQEIYRWLQKKYTQKNIIVWGESIGGGPACYLAERNQPGRLVLFSSFSGLDDVINMSTIVSSIWKYVMKVAKYCTNILPNREWIKKVKCPTLIVHSPDDKLIDVRQAEINYKAISHDNKQLLYITGDHSNPDMDVNSVKSIYRFIHNEELSDDKAVMCRKLVRKLIKELRANW